MRLKEQNLYFSPPHQLTETFQVMSQKARRKILDHHQTNELWESTQNQFKPQPQPQPQLQPQPQPTAPTAMSTMSTSTNSTIYNNHLTATPNFQSPPTSLPPQQSIPIQFPSSHITKTDSEDQLICDLIHSEERDW